MNLSDKLKEFIYLRRIAIASERQATALEKIAHIVTTEFELAQHPKPPRKQMEMDVMDPDEVAKDYVRRLEAERDGIDLDD